MIKASKQHIETFYQKLGYLFYSIAAADNVIQPEEVQQLHREVKEHWLTLEDTNDNFGTDDAFQIEIVFDWINDRQMDGEQAFLIFESFYKENPDMFDQKVISLIHSTANHISSSYHGINKKESVYLLRLHALLGS